LDECTQSCRGRSEPSKKAHRTSIPSTIALPVGPAGPTGKAKRTGTELLDVAPRFSGSAKGSSQEPIRKSRAAGEKRAYHEREECKESAQSTRAPAHTPSRSPLPASGRGAGGEGRRAAMITAWRLASLQPPHPQPFSPTGEADRNRISGFPDDRMFPTNANEKCLASTRGIFDFVGGD
jgi:hypothetical protein